MKLNTNYLINLIVFALAIFNISAKDIILENKTGYDLVVIAKYKSEDESLPILNTESIIVDNTFLNISTNFINKVLLKNENFLPDFKLFKLEASYKESIISNSLFKDQLGYKLILPVEEAKSFINVWKEDALIDIFPNKLSGGLDFKFYQNAKEYEDKKNQVIQSKSLKYINMLNQTGETLNVSLKFVMEYKFNQVRKENKFTIANDQDCLVPLFHEIEGNELKVDSVEVSLASKENFVKIDLDSVRKNNLQNLSKANIKVTKKSPEAYTFIGEFIGNKTGYYLKDSIAKIDENITYENIDL